MNPFGNVVGTVVELVVVAAGCAESAVDAVDSAAAVVVAAASAAAVAAAASAAASAASAAALALQHSSFHCSNLMNFLAMCSRLLNSTSGLHLRTILLLAMNSNLLAIGQVFLLHTLLPESLLCSYVLKLVVVASNSIDNWTCMVLEMFLLNVFLLLFLCCILFLFLY